MQREAEEKAIAERLEAERQARAEAERKMRKHHSVKLLGQVAVRAPRAGIKPRWEAAGPGPGGAP